MAVRLALRVESGGHGNTVVWGAQVRHDSNGGDDDDEQGTVTLSVVRQDPLEDSPSRTYESKLSKAAAKRLWKEVKRVAVWNLPRTDYSQNLSDDCYHLGISVEVEHKDFGTFKHQIPTGPIVLVSSVNPNWTELARFLTFVRSVTDTIEKASNVPVPDYVKLRWESRSKEIALLHALGGGAVKQQ